MKISNLILIGVEYTRVCQFWSTLKEYANQVEDQLKDHELIGLVISNEDNGDNVSETYYTVFEHNVFKTTNVSNKETNTITKGFIGLSSRDKMFEHIRKQKHILDLEYFLKNN